MESGSFSRLSEGTLNSDEAAGERKENQIENQLADNRRVLLAITVEIEDGCVEHIQLREGDSAEAVAIKFCQDHSLPEQFVAPLAEHIISNVISASREGSDISHSQEEHLSYDENSALRGGASHCPEEPGSDVVDSALKRRGHGGKASVTAEASAQLARRERRRNTDPPLMESQTLSGRDQGCHVHQCRPCDECQKPVARIKTRRRRGRKKVSDRLIAPTITSLAKTKATDYKEKPKSPHPKPVSEPAKAVYMRLYTEHIKHESRSKNELQRSEALCEQNYVRRKMGLSKTTWRLTRVRGKIAKQFKNYGELLYAEGLTKRQTHLKAVAEKKKRDEALELAELQLKPTISERAKNVDRGEGHVWSRLQNCCKPRENHIQELRQEVWETKFTECTFKPRINLNWNYNAHCEQGGVEYRNRFEQLFMDAECRRRRQAEYVEWYPQGVTFQPCINRRSPCCEASTYEDWPLERCVFRRLLENASKSNEKKRLLERLAHRPFDPSTGQELYKPRTGRKPHNRNPVRLPIGDYLYKMRFSLDRKLKNLHARDCQMKKEQAERQYVGPTSRKLLQRLKQRGLKQVFDVLDDDKDGFVDLTTANFDRVNDDVVEDLNRLMTWEGKGKKLNFEQFVDLMLVAEKKYHCGQQLHLGLKHKIHAGESPFTFQNEMDPLSRDLATKRRKYSTHNEWFRIISAEAAKRQQKVEDWRKARQEQEMAECTFKPELISTYKSKKALEPVDDNCSGGTIGDTISNIIDKVQQEVHGFCFQDKREGPELVEMPAPVSPSSSSRNMATKYTSASSSTTGTRNICCYCDSLGRHHTICDSPRANNPPAKSGMFFGLLGG